MDVAIRSLCVYVCVCPSALNHSKQLKKGEEIRAATQLGTIQRKVPFLGGRNTPTTTGLLTVIYTSALQEGGSAWGTINK